MRFYAALAVSVLALPFFSCRMAVPAPRDLNAPRVEVKCNDGKPQGQFKLRASNGVLQVRGEFQDGKKEGTWDFWDSSGAQIVKLSYHDGMKNGPCTMWYSSLSGDPRAGGRLKLDMGFVNDQIEGGKTSYYRGPGIGALRSETVFVHGKIVKARHWTPERRELSADEAMSQAEKDLDADQRYFDSLDEIVADNSSCTRDQN